MRAAASIAIARLGPAAAVWPPARSCRRTFLAEVRDGCRCIWLTARDYAQALTGRLFMAGGSLRVTVLSPVVDSFLMRCKDRVRRRSSRGHAPFSVRWFRRTFSDGLNGGGVVMLQEAPTSFKTLGEIEHAYDAACLKLPAQLQRWCYCTSPRCISRQHLKI